MRTKSYEPTFGGIRPIGARIKKRRERLLSHGTQSDLGELGRGKMERDGRKKMRPSLFSEADLVPPVNMTFVTGKKHDLLYDWGKNFALVLTRLSGQLLHSSILTLYSVCPVRLPIIGRWMNLLKKTNELLPLSKLIKTRNYFSQLYEKRHFECNYYRFYSYLRLRE